MVKPFQLGGNESGDVPTITPSSENISTKGSEWRMFLRTRDRDVALGYKNFLRGLEEFEGVPTRARVRSLENEIFQVSLLVASCCLLDM